ncbi:helix-turn-helix transcriptional regulator [Micrococcus luteus]|uniref:helix-turn-helix transcriptional regulator n=2 Tax=Micrococcus TaxID=1269 RepID=UPI00119DA75F|nr:helix-turn-helix domain-containing protein [Micrococcus luteus]
MSKTKKRSHLRLVSKENWMRVTNPAALQRRRVREGFTQRDLGMLVGRSHTTIYHLEKGSMKTLSVELGEAIARRLKSDVEDFFEYESAERAGTLESGSRSTVRTGAAA